MDEDGRGYDATNSSKESIGNINASRIKSETLIWNRGRKSIAMKLSVGYSNK